MSRPRKSYPAVKDAVGEFFKEKNKIEYKRKQSYNYMKNTYESSGIKLSDDEDEEILPQTERKQGKTRLREGSVHIPNFHRGLQAFDFALNPNAEEIVRTAAAGNSLKSDPTDWHDNIQSISRKPALSRYSRGNSVSTSSTYSRNRSLSDTQSFLSYSSSYQYQSKKDTGKLSLEESILATKFVFQSVIDEHTHVMTVNNSDDLPWLVDRLETSSRSCSFTIPMDVLEFKSMTPIEYLQRFCKVSKDRQIYYKRCFDNRLDKKQDNHEKHIDGDRLVNALSDVLLKSVKRVEILDFLKLVNISMKNQTPVYLKDFTLISALADRILCVSLVSIPLLKKYHDPRDFLERADFGGLARKLHGVHFKHNRLLKLLFSLS